MISFSHKGNFKHLESFLKRAKNPPYLQILERYGQEGVNALSAATPRATGETATSWYYKVSKTNNSYKITWHNSHVENGVSIAILLQYGHGTRNGGYVQGVDYINPALKSVFEKMANTAWGEVTRP